jgi:hypothetical protein
MLSGKTIVTTDTSLKVIKANAYKQGYNKAIDDFAEEICNRAYEKNGFLKIRVIYLCKIAEQLKEGEKHDN